jgi:hypothetical protein
MFIFWAGPQAGSGSYSLQILTRGLSIATFYKELPAVAFIKPSSTKPQGFRVFRCYLLSTLRY